MKKRNIFVVLILTLSMLLSACGTPDPFVGKWVGTFDMTNLVMDLLAEEEDFESYSQYLELKDLNLKVDFNFEDGVLTLGVDDASVDALVENLETSMYNMMDSMMKDVLIQMYQEMFEEVETLDDIAAMTGGMYENGQEILDDLAVSQGYADYDTFIKESIESVDMGSMMADACASLNLYGDYKYDEESGILTIYYEDSTYEEMNYKFEGENLIISVAYDGYTMDFVCEKVSE